MSQCLLKPTSQAVIARRQTLAFLMGLAVASKANATPALASIAGIRLPLVQAAQGKVANQAWNGLGHLGSEDFKGHWIYLDFWASWCAPCRQSFPWMNSIHDKFEPLGLQIVAVGLDKKPEPMQSFLNSTKPRFSILWDRTSAWAEKLQIQSMPASVLIKPDGQMMAWHKGFSREMVQKVETQLSQWLLEKA
jgi:thiol-disulfide isomerase/thioredoxin